MDQYISNLIMKCPAKLLNGLSMTPAVNHLFEVNEDCRKLDLRMQSFSTIWLPSYYTCVNAPGLTFSLLCHSSQPECSHLMRMISKQLGQRLHYLHDTKDCTLTLDTHNMAVIKWWVNASFTAHQYYKSHTGATMTLGCGSIVSLSNKQKINTCCSMEVEQVE